MIEQKENFRVLEKLVDSDKVVFVFTAFGTKIGLYRFFVSLLNKKGYSVVIYDFGAEAILKAELSTWEKLYKDVIEDGQQRLKSFKQEGKAKFYAYGVSMGTLVANKFTRDTPDITHLAISLTYGDVATQIWISPAVKKARENLEQQGININVLRRAIHYADPITNVAGLKGKKVWLHLSRRDKILDYNVSIKTKEAFENNIKEFSYTESKYLGHYGAGAKHMLSINKLVKFFNS